MSFVMAATAAVGVAPSVIGLFKSGKQKREAEALAASNKFTQFKTPGEAIEAKNLAENAYYSGMPGTETMKNNLMTSSATAFGNAEQASSSSGDVLDSITKINNNENAALNNLGVQEAGYKMDALKNYQNQLGTMAGYKEKEYDNNFLQPYLRKANTAASMMGAAQMNEAKSLDGISTGLMAAATMGQNKKNGGN